MKKQYIYPHNMKTKAQLWFWTLKDIIVLGVALVLSVVAWAKLGFVVPAAVTLLYAFLTMRIEETSVWDFIKRARRYFMSTQQYFEWKEKDDG
jgi:hypothetical protein